MKRRTRGICVFLLLAALSLTGCSFFGKTLVWDTQSLHAIGNIFAINDSKCTSEEARLYLANYTNLYGSAYGIDLLDHDFGDASLTEYIQSVTLDELTRIYVLDELAETAGMELDEAEITKVAECASSYMELLGKQQATALGLDEKELKTCYEHYALAEKYFADKLQVTDAQISEEDARVIHARVCLTTDQENTAAVAKALESGKDFTTTASAYNTTDSVDVYVTRGMYPEEVEKVIYYLEDGETAGPITTAEGTYFFYIISKYDEEKSEQNREQVRSDREAAAYQAAYDSFLQEASVVLNETRWKDLLAEDISSVTTDDFFEVYEQVFGE